MAKATRTGPIRVVAGLGAAGRGGRGGNGTHDRVSSHTSWSPLTGSPCSVLAVDGHLGVVRVELGGGRGLLAGGLDADLRAVGQHDPADGGLGPARPVEAGRFLGLPDGELQLVAVQVDLALQPAVDPAWPRARCVPFLLRSEISSPSTVPRSQDSTLSPSHRYAAALFPSTATAMAVEPSSVRPAYTAWSGNCSSSSVAGARRRRRGRARGSAAADGGRGGGRRSGGGRTRAGAGLAAGAAELRQVDPEHDRERGHQADQRDQRTAMGHRTSFLPGLPRLQHCRARSTGHVR